MEDAEGLREKFQGEMNVLEAKISELKQKIESQQSLIEKQLSTVRTYVKRQPFSSFQTKKVTQLISLMKYPGFNPVCLRMVGYNED